MRNIVVLFDSGHGGMIGGNYVTAPNKMYKHRDGTIAYEGVINREIKDRVFRLFDLNGITYFDVSPGELDTPLPVRVDVANRIFNEYRDTHLVVYLSLHSNAGNGTGFEVYTSPGRTLSDSFATIWGEEIQKMFPLYKFRKDLSDGDLDKEAKFYVLMHTECPAVLAEYLFFDNYNDWVYQQTDDYKELAALSILSFVNRAELEIGGRF